MLSASLETVIDNHLDRIANLLLINASFVNDAGLLNGKMGIAIFFYHYSRYTGNKLYERYAGDLIDDIIRGISKISSIDFENGLTGIGWGVEHLVHQGFLEADTDEVLEEMDTIIYRNKLQMPILLNNGDDLFGNGLYYLARLNNSTKGTDNLKNLVKMHHLIFLTDECERLLIHKRFLDFNILYLSCSTLKSLCFFLLEMIRLELYPEKIDLILKHLPLYLEFNKQKNDNPVGGIGIIQFINRIVPCLTEIDLQIKYLAIAKGWKDNLSENEPDIESTINIFIDTAWQEMIYAPYYRINNDLSFLTKKAYSILEKEETWNKMVDNQHMNNMSLRGFAGLGLRFLNDRV